MFNEQKTRGEWPVSIQSMKLDWKEGSAVVTLDNGYTNVSSFPVDRSTLKGPIRTSEYFPSSNELHVKTDNGETLVAELPALGQTAPIAGRPVVYLDQKDWSVLANVIHEPKKVLSSIERDAASRLIEMAQDRRIILPMSMGHLTETGQWTDAQRRYRLALTILQLSRGWQIRHPVGVRQHEIMRSMSSILGRPPVPPIEVITLAPGAVQSDSLFYSPSKFVVGLPPDMAVAVDACICLMSYFSTVLDAGDVQMGPISEWELASQALTESLSTVAGSREQRRKRAGALFLRDLQYEVLLAARSLHIREEEVSSWLESLGGFDFSSMPSIGIFREIYISKHLDKTSKWHKNDLIDMMYLCCAAGYADFVLGERSLVSRISQAASKLHRRPSAYRSLSELMASLRSDEA